MKTTETLNMSQMVTETYNAMRTMPDLYNQEGTYNFSVPVELDAMVAPAS